MITSPCLHQNADILCRELRENGKPLLELRGVRGLDINKTFDCGQCFRFDKEDSSRHESVWSGVAKGRTVSFASDGDVLYIYGADRADFDSVWYDYLDLGTDYDLAAADILSRSDSGALKSAVEYGHGIRILRQEPWETVCSFIISQNNNIPRIKKLVSALCASLGEPLSDGGFAFPSAEAVCDGGIELLLELKTGFRAKYIYDAASRVSSGDIDLDEIFDMPVSLASDELCRIKGVGPKVAACSLLFGFGKHDAFPVDVWIKRAMEKYFLGDFDPARLGPYAGIAQQYLFYYERYLGGENA